MTAVQARQADQDIAPVGFHLAADIGIGSRPRGLQGNDQSLAVAVGRHRHAIDIGRPAHSVGRESGIGEGGIERILDRSLEIERGDGCGAAAQALALQGHGHLAGRSRVRRRLAVGWNVGGGHLEVDRAREIGAGKGRRILQPRDMQLGTPRSPRLCDREIDDVQHGARPFALEGGHGETVSVVAEATFQRERLINQVAVGRHRALDRAGRVARQRCRQRQAPRRQRAVMEIAHLARDAEIGALGTLADVGRDLGAAGKIRLHPAELRQVERQIEIGDLHLPASGDAEDGIVGGSHADVPQRPGLIELPGRRARQPHTGIDELWRHAGRPEVADRSLPGQGHPLGIRRRRHIPGALPCQRLARQGRKDREIRQRDRRLQLPNLARQDVGPAPVQQGRRRSEVERLHRGLAVGKAEIGLQPYWTQCRNLRTDGGQGDVVGVPGQGDRALWQGRQRSEIGLDLHP